MDKLPVEEVLKLNGIELTDYWRLHYPQDVNFVAWLMKLQKIVDDKKD